VVFSTGAIRGHRRPVDVADTRRDAAVGGIFAGADHDVAHADVVHATRRTHGMRRIADERRRRQVHQRADRRPRASIARASSSWASANRNDRGAFRPLSQHHRAGNRDQHQR
jgi:hypothetical protein